MTDTEFSTAIVERDGECVFCHRMRGMRERLVAHHILHKGNHPRARYDMRNGIALCAECHTGSNPAYPSVHRYPEASKIRAINHLVAIGAVESIDAWDAFAREMRK